MGRWIRACARVSIRPFVVFGLVLVGSCLLGCPGDQSVPLPPDNPAQSDALIRLSPEVLDFGQTVFGNEYVLTLTLTNSGSETLYLEDLAVEGPMAFSVDEQGVDRMLAPGGETSVDVTCTAVPQAQDDGTLYITSNDNERPRVAVPLHAALRSPIQLEPAIVDFGDPEIGCSYEQTVAIRNAGEERLTLADVVFEPTSDELEAEILNPSGLMLEPGFETTVTVRYTPRDPWPDTGYLRVSANDPDLPDAVGMAYGAAHPAFLMADEFVQVGSNQTDVLWVIDNSCSMNDDQNMLAMNFTAFLEVAAILDMDYHVGVVTTDDSTLQGPIPIITPSTPDALEAFSEAVDLGSMGSAIEQGLEFGWGAVSPPLTDPGNTNDGFVREDAALHVIFVSDEADQSPDPVEEYVQRFQSIKDHPDRVKLSAFVATNWSVRYQQAAAMTGGMVEFLEVPDWGAVVTQLAWLSDGQRRSFPLSHEPLAGSITVEFDGVPVPQGWQHDVHNNAIVFDPVFLPDPGEQFTARYVGMPVCAE